MNMRVLTPSIKTLLHSRFVAIFFHLARFDLRLLPRVILIVRSFANCEIQRNGFSLFNFFVTFREHKEYVLLLLSNNKYRDSLFRITSSNARNVNWQFQLVNKVTNIKKKFFFFDDDISFILAILPISWNHLFQS